VRRVRFVAAAARREFLAEVVYYNEEEPGLGARFTTAVEEATSRALAFPLAGSPRPRILGGFFSRTSHSRSFISQPPVASLCSLSRTIRFGQVIGGRVCKSANQRRHGDTLYIAPSAPFQGRACCER